MSIIYAWRCQVCYEVHRDEDDARECCPTDIEEGAICPICLKYHSTEKRAYDCCGYQDGQDIPVRPEELEAAGQGRLLP